MRGGNRTQLPLDEAPDQPGGGYHRGFQVMGEHVDQVAALGLQALYRGQVPQDDGPALGNPAMVPEGEGTDHHRHLLARTVAQGEFLRYLLLPLQHQIPGAQVRSPQVDDFLSRAAHGLPPAKAGQSLGRRVEFGDPPLLIRSNYRPRGVLDQKAGPIVILGPQWLWLFGHRHSGSSLGGETALSMSWSGFFTRS